MRETTYGASAICQRPHLEVAGMGGSAKQGTKPLESASGSLAAHWSTSSASRSGSQNRRLAPYAELSTFFYAVPLLQFASGQRPILSESHSLTEDQITFFLFALARSSHEACDVEGCGKPV